MSEAARSSVGGRQWGRARAMAVIAALLVWLGAGWGSAPPAESGRFLVRVWIAGFSAGALAPGWFLAPPGLARVVEFPSGAQPLFARITGRAGAGPAPGGRGLASREGAAVFATLAVSVIPGAGAASDLVKAFPAGWDGGRAGELIGQAIAADLARHASGRSVAELVGAPPADLASVVALALEETGLALAGEAQISFYPRGSAQQVREPPDKNRAGAGSRVLLIGLDGADWEVIDPLMKAGRMPNLSRLVAGGVRARLKTISPVLSPIIWTSIATGVGPERHGIVDFLATSATTGRQIPVTSNMRKVKAIWNILSERGRSVGMVAWWASWPAEPVDGFVISDRVAYQLFGFRESGEGLRNRAWPESLSLRIQPQVVPPAALTAAELGRFFVDPAGTLPAGADHEQRLRSTLATARTYSAIANDLLRAYDPDLKAVYFEGTDTIAHNFMRYRPPAMPGATPAEAGILGGVVDRYYEYQDELLGPLLQLADERTVTVVCSDHGFRSGANRPPTDPRIDVGGAADWHRKFGILVLNGPGIRSGATLEDASVLDLTPTLLAIMGLPVARDMTGRALMAAFTEARPVESIATYESGAAGSAVAGPIESAVDEEIVQKLTALGYVGQEGSNALNNTGITLLDRGRYAEAADVFARAVAQEPRFAMARINLGRARMLMKDYDAALQAFSEALQLDPSQSEVYNLIGNIHMERGAYRQAEASFKKSLEARPNDTHTHNSLGLLYDRLGRDDEAIREYERVVAIDPDYAEGFNNIGLIHRKRGDPREALALFRRAIEADADFPGSYNNMGLAWQDIGNLSAAREAFQRGLEVDPANAVILNNFGTLELAEGKLEEARERFEQAIREDPAYAAAVNNLGAVLGMLGRRDEELEQYLRAAELDPNYADARFNIARHLISTGQAGEAEEMLRKVLAIDPHYGKALLQLGLIQAQRSEYAAALDLTNRAVAALPRMPEAHALRGELLARLGRRGEAERALEESLRLKPDQPRVRRFLEDLRVGITTAPSP